VEVRAVGVTTWIRGWVGSCIRLAFLAIGLAMALNIGGLANRHERESVRVAEPLKTSRPWRNLSIPTDDEGMPYPKHLKGMNRLLGAAFAFLGVVFLVGYLVIS
jgi:hypothetical protein